MWQQTLSLLPFEPAQAMAPLAQEAAPEAQNVASDAELENETATPRTDAILGLGAASLLWQLRSRPRRGEEQDSTP